MSAEEIFSEIEKLSGGKPLMISLSGGNPAIQPLSGLIKLGKQKGYQFALETQGSIAQDWFADLDVLTLSPKPPSSGMETDWVKLDQCVKAATLPPLSPRTAGGKSEAEGGSVVAVSLKIVVFDEQDYLYAKDAAARYPTLPVYLQPGNHVVNGPADQGGLMERMRWLIDRTLSDGWYAAKILPQLHVLIWGNKRGV
jgi:7-carboxy-7-deazaguanine synthase